MRIVVGHLFPDYLNIYADRGNMAIFKTRAAAEQFVKEDPFILEGLVKSFAIRDWNDNLIPG